MLFICNTYDCNVNTTIKSLFESLKIKVLSAFSKLGLQSGDDCNLKLNEANYLTLEWKLLKSTKTSTNKVTFSLIILKLVVKFTHSLCPFPPSVCVSISAESINYHEYSLNRSWEESQTADGEADTGRTEGWKKPKEAETNHSNKGNYGQTSFHLNQPSLIHTQSGTF